MYLYYDPKSGYVTMCYLRFAYYLRFTSGGQKSQAASLA